MQDEEKRQADLRLQLQKRLERVSPELFAMFLYEKKVQAVHCVMCGHEDLGTPQAEIIETGPNGSSSRAYVDYIKLTGGGAPYSLANYQYRLICNTCGFTIHFAAYPVIKWIEERDSKNG